MQPLPRPLLAPPGQLVTKLSPHLLTLPICQDQGQRHERPRVDEVEQGLVHGVVSHAVDTGTRHTVQAVSKSTNDSDCHALRHCSNNKISEGKLVMLQPGDRLNTCTWRQRSHAHLGTSEMPAALRPMLTKKKLRDRLNTCTSQGGASKQRNTELTSCARCRQVTRCQPLHAARTVSHSSVCASAQCITQPHLNNGLWWRLPGWQAGC